MESAERQAAGWYFGVSNLAMGPPKPHELIAKHGEDWEKIYWELRNHAMGMVESDDMWDMVQEEVGDWVGQLDRMDDWCVKEWTKLKEVSHA